MSLALISLAKADDGICKSATWNRQGVTIAGNNEEGSGLNQLSAPQGLFVDDNDTIYVADTFNHRIVKWIHGASSGQVVAGGNEVIDSIDSLDLPVGVVVTRMERCLSVIVKIDEFNVG